jgi:hypothetical protein
MGICLTETQLRAAFNQAVESALAQWVSSLFSNPSYMADTTDPQGDPSNVLNVRIAVHITAAAFGGPLSQERRGKAEQNSIARLGEMNSRASLDKHLVTALKRDLKIRDGLRRDLLKTSSELMNLPRFKSRVSKFAHSEVIIHRIDDRSYPDIDEAPGISGWFKLELLDFYHGGLDGVIGLEYALIDSMTRRWALLTYEQSESSFEGRFTKAKVFKTGKIPWRNILHYDMRRDEYYPMPHLYCKYADAGAPYEGFGYFLLGDGREWELRAEEKVELEALLASDGER